MPVARLAPTTAAGVLTAVCAAWVGCDGTRRLHGLNGHGRPVVRPTYDQGNTEGEQDAERVHAYHADVGDDERDERSQVAERSGPLHAVEAIGCGTGTYRGRCPICV